VEKIKKNRVKCCRDVMGNNNSEIKFKKWIRENFIDETENDIKSYGSVGQGYAMPYCCESNAKQKKIILLIYKKKKKLF